MMNALESTSTRPYLIRALYDWCTDNGLTPNTRYRYRVTAQGNGGPNATGVVVATRTTP